MQKNIELIINLLKKKNIKIFEFNLSSSSSISTVVRLGKIEELEYYHSSFLDISVHINNKVGRASTVNLANKSIEKIIEAAINITKYTEKDKFATLAPKDVMAFNAPNLDLYHKWNLSSQQAINMAKECEDIALQQSCIDNSNGSRVSSSNNTDIYVNSHNLVAQHKSTQHYIDCSVLAKKNNDLQSSYAYSLALAKDKLYNVVDIGIQAAMNAKDKLAAKTIKSNNYAVIFSNKISNSLIASLLTALSGSNQYKKSTFLLNSINEIICNKNINIIESPLTLGSIGSRAFDNDGVLKRKQYFIKNGKVVSYIMGQYYANCMQSLTTANGGGVNNVVVTSKDNITFTELLSMMGTGVVINELKGQGVDITNGNYSLGANGFMVENGKKIYPVNGITIAGNLKDMIKDMIIANDIDHRKNIKVGAILINNMTIASS